MEQEFKVRLSERVARLETREETLTTLVAGHGVLIEKLDTKISILVDQVKQIRNALYLMAFCIAANIPGASKIIEVIKFIFGF